MALLSVALVVAVCAALVAFSASGSAKKSAQAAQDRLAQLEKQLAEQEQERSRAESEMQACKAELRAQKDALKALKKKRFEDKRPVATAVVGAGLDALALDRAWRKAEDERTAAEQEKNALQAQVQELQNALAAAKKVPERLVERVVARPVDRSEVEVEKKAQLDARRKLEWARRIYLVQQKELELAHDKTAHIRKRFLEVCTELVRVQKPSKETEQEIARMNVEQAAYESAQLKLEQEDKNASAEQQQQESA